MCFTFYTILLFLHASFKLSSAIEDEEIAKSISTSVIGMKTLLESERLMVRILSDYADELEQKLSIIRDSIYKMRIELEKSKSNEENYLGNPINAFSLIRRMHTDWHNWQVYLKEPIGLNLLEEFVAQASNRPSEGELIEAIHSMHRIQKTYDINPSDMAKGLLNGKQYDAQFSTVDLFTIGAQLFEEMHLFDAGWWLHAALVNNEVNSIDAVLGFNRSQVYKLYKEVLNKQRHFSQLNKPFQPDLFKLQETWEAKESANHWTLDPVYMHYKSGCRGEFPLRPYNLHCRYNTTAHDFLKLAPLKMEEISLEPYIILYHDVLLEHEITFVKSLAENELKRSGTIDVNGTTDFSDYRTSHTYWIDEVDYEITYRIRERIMQMTRFDMTLSEPLQILNYGIGGHYYLHTDDLLEAVPEVVKESGDRISTIIFYMSDVEQGGATVFPSINVSITPQKGAALMWYNLDNSGDSVPKTLHAGCPVLVGSKWVFNKWISDRHQFRIKPCFKE